MTNAASYCAFFVGGLLFGIDVRAVREVLHQHPVTPVPLSGAAVTGLLNLRGEIVTVVDLRHRLELPARAPGAATASVVVRSGITTVGLLVDELSHVVEIEGLALETPPETMPSSVRSLVPSVCQLPGALLHLIDVDLAVIHGSPSST